MAETQGTGAWLAHVKNVQKFYKEQGTPLTWNQSLVVARKSWQEMKAGNTVEMKVEKDIPVHNTRPRVKAPKEQLKEAPTKPVEKKKSKPKKVYESESSDDEPPRKKKIVYVEEPRKKKKRDIYPSSSSEDSSSEEEVIIRKKKKSHRY